MDSRFLFSHLKQLFSHLKQKQHRYLAMTLTLGLLISTISIALAFSTQWSTHFNGGNDSVVQGNGVVWNIKTLNTGQSVALHCTDYFKMEIQI